ncbi:unnamed protein product [Somion occarium]|uniref:F-box domain-containing protein n=1 Tax=Somion occarium TaxID=3059160 RepID=A0ABP1D9B6_9APHY
MSTPSSSAPSVPSSSYVCDTLPAPRLVGSSSRLSSLPPLPTPPITAFHAPIVPDVSLKVDDKPREQVQKALDALPVEEREAVNTIWTNFSSSPHPRRALILQGLLTMCCFSQLSLLTEQLSQLIRIDPFTVLPREVSLKILGYLDATSLCRAAQVSRQWKSLADDDILWRGICEQHIGQKCLKCGWGLPILEKRRAIHLQPTSPCPSPSHDVPPLPHNKRDLDLDHSHPEPPAKRQRVDAGPSDRSPRSPMPSSSQLALISTRTSTPNPLVPPSHAPATDTVTRPWKDVYCERLTIERNWRRGRCVVQTLKGHTDGVMCLQFSETLSHPAFPILITGSYDRTARVWNLETGRELHCLTGHTRAVRALQFDEAKLITGSMDHTMRVWDWRTGKCLRTLEGHTEGVVCLNFDSNVLASGSVDSTVKVWNFRTGECFTLRGHRDWVNAVQLWDSGNTNLRGGSPCPDARPSSPYNGSMSHIDPGKMLFSASDDGTIRLWDLTQRACVKQFTGHVGQVQSLKLLLADQGCDDSGSDESTTSQSQEIDSQANNRPAQSSSSSNPPAFRPSAVLNAPDSVPNDVPTGAFIHTLEDSDSSAKGKEKAVDADRSPAAGIRKPRKPVLISGSLDNTIKVWDIDSGKAVRTLFGHIEGVWAVASDNLRLVSGSHDRTIKVWNREEGRCTATLVGHRGAVTCLALGEDKIVSGSDDGDVRLWSFSG